LATANEGLTLAIRAALADANVRSDEIDAIIPQGCGVPGLDHSEAASLREVFGSRLASIPLVTVSPFVGDCAAGNGAVLAACAALCLRNQKLPARIHPGGYPADLNVGEAASREATLSTILVCTSSMGGQCAAMVFRKAA
jgi:3-oxoacyl-[acyl-carrier-protein] synthase II